MQTLGLIWVREVVSAVIDLAAFVFLARFLFPANRQAFWAVLSARLISGNYNYLLNRHLVFAKAGQHTVLKYIGLAIVQAGLAAALTGMLVMLFSASLNLETVIKVLVDLVLFVFSYQVQKRWIFNGN